MTGAARIDWGGSDEAMLRAMGAYARAVLKAVHQVAEYWQAVFEAYAKEHAPWTDRTSNARQSLHAWIDDLSNDVVVLYLSHGMHYGIFLERRWAGKYAIIWPTIEAHLAQIAAMLRGIFG